MWIDEELKERISKLSDEDLLHLVEADFADYRKEALEYAKAELMARDISFEDPSTEAESNLSDVASKTSTCPACGGAFRFGRLFADKELTIVFADNDEERFVEMCVCGNCGQVQLIVDYETDVRH